MSDVYYTIALVKEAIKSPVNYSAVYMPKPKSLHKNLMLQ